MRTMTISGNLGNDPEIRQTNSGMNVANFSVAVRRNRPDKDGSYNSDWVRCSLFGKRADVIERYFHKGNHVVVTGEWGIDTFQGNDGTQRTNLTLNVQDFDLPDRAPQAGQSSQTKQTQDEPVDVSDDDLPF